MTKVELLKNSVISANKKYLQNVLKNIPQENHKQVEVLFQKHMADISEYIQNIFMNDGLLTEGFIRGLHKKLFPPGYTESKKTLSGDGEYIYMIPGVYKTLPNFDWVDPKDVKEKMSQLIKWYNTKEKKLDTFLFFLVYFLKIHPFGNGNGRLVSILVDSMLIYHEYSPIFFSELQEKNKKIKDELINAIKKDSITEIKNLLT